jgi:alpha-D-ribose 1-methylphosphonate 5-triphosphate synthase subunit PhnH
MLVSALVQKVLKLRDSQHYEYPQGVDLLFVSPEGELFAIPRGVRQEG